jgi:prepilin-type N-terminal cleavage/methylation domain-containing protein
MKKQTGFTLIELMVVMAIIAILATAGLSAYTGYLKKARDTTRIADISAINNIVMGMTNPSNGASPDTVAKVGNAIKDANNNVDLLDPMAWKAVCLSTATGNTLGVCTYWYAQCDEGTGYAIATTFESKTNQGLYATDPTGLVAASVAGATGAGGIATIPTSTAPAVPVLVAAATTSAADAFYMVGSCKAYQSASATGVKFFTAIPAGV